MQQASTISSQICFTYKNDRPLTGCYYRTDKQRYCCSHTPKLADVCIHAGKISVWRLAMLIWGTVTQPLFFSTSLDHQILMTAIEIVQLLFGNIERDC